MFVSIFFTYSFYMSILKIIPLFHGHFAYKREAHVTKPSSSVRGNEENRTSGTKLFLKSMCCFSRIVYSSYFERDRKNKQKRQQTVLGGGG